MAHQNSKKPAQKISKHRYGRLIVGLLLSLFSLTTTGYWLLNSQTGLHWAATAINRLSSDAIRLNGARGTLRNMQIENIFFNNDELELALHNTNITWSPTHLLLRRITIDRLSLQTLHVSQRSTETADLPSQPPESLRLPFALAIAKLSIDSIHFVSPALENAEPDISGLRLSLDSDGQHHQVKQLSFDTSWGSVEAQTELGGDAPFALSARLGVSAAGSRGNIVATVTGNLEQIMIQADSQSLAAKMTLHAQLQPFAVNPVKELQAALEQWNPMNLFNAAPHALLSLSAQLAQNSTGQLEGKISIENRATATLDSGGLPVAAIQTNALIGAESLTLPDFYMQLGTAGSVRGKLSWNWKKQFAATNLTVEKLDPRQIDSRLHAALISGKIHLSGDTTAQSARVDLQDSSLRLHADMTRTGDYLMLEQFILQRNRSHLTGHGKLHLGHEQSFELSGRLENFNSADFFQAIDSNLNASLQLTGQLTPALSGTFKYAIQNSRLAKAPISGAGEVTFIGFDQFVGKAELKAGSNRLHAQGNMVNNQQTFQLMIDAPALSQLGLKVSGDLQTKLIFRGTIEDPDLDWKLTSKRFNFGENQHFSGIAANARWHKDRLAFNVAVDTYTAHEQATIKQLSALLDGKTANHNLTIKALINEDIAVQLTASGGLRRERSHQSPHWHGKLIEFSSSGRIPVRLLAPAALSGNAGSFSLHQAGFSISGGTVHINKLHWMPGIFKTQGHFSGIALLPDIPKRPNLAPLQLGGHWDFDSGLKLNGELQIHREQGDWYFPDEMQQPYKLEKLQLHATVRHDKLTSQLVLISPLLGTAEAELTLPLHQSHGQWSVSRESLLQGNINATISSLKWLNNLFGEDFHTDGELRIQTSIQGTLKQPDVNGTISGNNLSLTLLEPGIRLQQGSLTGHFQQTDLSIDRLHFVSPHVVPPDNRIFRDLDLQGTTGSLTIIGNIGLTGTASHLDFTINQLPLAHDKDYWLIASGSGTAALKQNLLSVTGDLRTDAGLLRQPPEGSPELPEDVVLINTATPQRKQKLPLHLDMNLNLGEKFHIRASGLEGRLTGQLKIRNDQNQQLKLSGTIATQDASFKAYGQNLTVKRGIVSFQGPLDDPDLNVRAVREGLAVEAGIEIMGSVRHPRVRLVSVPDVSDTEKLSWIVLGRKPDVSGLDTSTLLSAAGSILGDQSGSGIMEQIKTTLGVDEISFKQAGIGSSLSGQIGVIGKRISSRAYLSYERGLTATTMGITKLNYNLTPKITIVTQAGEDSAIDTFYTIQFD